MNEADGNGVASIMKADDGVPSHWLTYVVVPSSLEDGRNKVTALGGEILAPGIPVPGVGRFAIVKDNIGTVLGIFEAANASAIVDCGERLDRRSSYEFRIS